VLSINLVFVSKSLSVVSIFLNFLSTCVCSLGVKSTLSLGSSGPSINSGSAFDTCLVLIFLIFSFKDAGGRAARRRGCVHRWDKTSLVRRPFCRTRPRSYELDPPRSSSAQTRFFFVKLVGQTCELDPWSLQT
jgi:hypothetical protein